MVPRRSRCTVSVERMSAPARDGEGAVVDPPIDGEYTYLESRRCRPQISYLNAWCDVSPT
jgi:hypothetical protein